MSCAAGGRVMDGASGHLRLMGRDCSRPSPRASFSLCLIKLNYSACPRQSQLFIIIIPIFNLVRKMVKWEFAMVNFSAVHRRAKHSAAHNLLHLSRYLAAKHSQLRTSLILLGTRAKHKEILQYLTFLIDDLEISLRC